MIDWSLWQPALLWAGFGAAVASLVWLAITLSLLDGKDARKRDS